MRSKNRIAMTPMGTNYGETSGEMSNRHMNYYSLRAKGGVGLIILENANIEYPAKRVQAIGFDAIEIHCGHSYLMSQFISPYYNKRTDEFGGSVENRLRFPRMVLEEVRKNVGPCFPIIVRISAEERVPGGNTLEDTLEYLDEFVDMYDVSCGLNPSLQYQIDSNFLPDGWRSYMVRAVKDKFGKPVMNAGNYRDPEIVEKVLESGDVDIVGMGRGLIAEPDWVKKGTEWRRMLSA